MPRFVATEYLVYVPWMTGCRFRGNLKKINRGENNELTELMWIEGPVFGVKAGHSIIWANLEENVEIRMGTRYENRD